MSFIIQDRNATPSQTWKITYKNKQQEQVLELTQVNNLFPDDFIVQLKSPTNYVGAQRIFETIADDGVDKLPVLVPIDDYIDDFPSRVMQVNEDDVVGVERFDSKSDWDKRVGKLGTYKDFISYSDYRKGTRAAKSIDSFPVEIPSSLKDAVMCFILGIAVRELRQPKMLTSNLYQPHNTMLIHISRFTLWQSKTQRLLKTYYSELLSRLMMDKPNVAGSIYLSFEKVWRKHYFFIVTNIRDYLPEGYEDEFMSPTSFNSLIPNLIDSAKGVDVLALNSQTNDVLDYDKAKPKKVIAIGGNRLSRGFTLEGLITSYFVRTTNYSDSLLQMGRWFGYRPGYLDCCKLFTSQDLIDKYVSTTLCVEELKAEFKKMDDMGRNPSEYELRVRTHAGVLQITRPTILKNTQSVKWSYQDSLQMSTSINVKPNHIEEVWQAFKNNIVQQMKGAKLENSLLHKKVDAQIVIDILKGKNNFEPTTCELFISYIEKCNEKGLLTDWTIAIKTTGSAKADAGKGFLLSSESGLEHDIQLAIRKGPTSTQRFFDELVNNFVFKATSKSANIMSSARDMEISVEQSLIPKLIENYQTEQVQVLLNNDKNLSDAEAKKIVVKKTIPERVFREKMSPENGVLIVYLFDTYYSLPNEQTDDSGKYARWVNDNGIDLNIPLVGLALGFPPISRKKDPCGTYVKGDYKLEAVADPDEDDIDDYEDSEGLLPEDRDTL